MRFCPRCGSRYEHERFCPEDGAATEPLPDAGPHKDALIGTLVDGRYRIEEQIGEGGMGVVYKAKHIALQKTLALKVLRGEVAKDPEVVQRFMQEAQSATSIGHENIIDINDFGTLQDGTAYFVMEFLKGRPLSDLIARGGPIPMRDAVQILRQVAGALGAAHARGIVHRDLKPDNVFVLARGEIENFVKVLDFGIAKVGSSKNKITRTGMVFGTPHYMSPEQAAGQSVDARTDVYALGVMMYEMFTGHVPFDADTFMGVLTKHMFEKPAPMFGDKTERSLGALEQITMRALEKKQEHRYESMAALVADLDRVVGGGSPRAHAGQRISTELADALEPRSKSELHLEQQLGARGEGDESPPQQERQPAREDSGRYSEEPTLPTAKRWPYVAAVLALLVAGALALMTRKTQEPTLAVVPDVRATADAGGALPSGLAGSGQSPTSAAANAEPVQADEDLKLISVSSEPSGADIVLEGAIIGRTPGHLARPLGQHIDVELQLEGYAPQPFALSADTPSKLHLTLRRRAAVAKKPVATGKPAASRPKASSTSSPAPAADKPKRRRLTSEVVDPWAD